ncbi:type I 3-dehydroquinate dehydratase [Macrococcus equipercicus]|uniref:3-dehydroquinate dehydratase n=1 Tax=Macrococcus equipercicus TaxID=69967 RepID=A0ABQ6RBD2_9STAP|nr:type I 3-dehydroquinate dehydratase [Macrococcus equipercicus]KAA1042508.1 type I 3-dehydroquinate dehydratase [Macrococcus equipercicus]
MDKCSVTPKIVVTLSSTNNDWKETIERLSENMSYIDMMEYRADLCGELAVEDYIADLKMLKEQFTLPLIFTYRSKGQGGKGEKEPHAYYELVKEIVAANIIDIIDIELLLYEDLMDELIEAARMHHVQVLISHHEFDHTPSSKDLIALYNRMQGLGADFSKVAVMPADVRDVLKLLLAVYETKQNCDNHIVGIAMGEQGKLSRIAGGSFGSSLTYGHIGEEAAPGQLHVKQLKSLLEIY